MDFVIRFIGIILIVKGGTSANVPVMTAFFPASVEGRSFCNGDVTPPPHAVFIRINDQQIVREQTDWNEQRPCDSNALEPCTLFLITEPSELMIEPGFAPTAAVTSTGDTYCRIPTLDQVNDTVRLIDHPESASMLTFKLPPGVLESEQLGDGSFISYVRVPAPTTRPVPITIRAKAQSGRDVRTLVVKAGTTINLLNIMPHRAGGDLNAPAHNRPSDAENHYFLYNALVSPDQELCDTPILKLRPECPALTQTHINHGMNGDPFCSVNGCCP